MPAAESDEDLMGRFQAGDARAFEVLMRRHRGPVHGFLSRLVGDGARAEDLGQETWLKVIDAAPRWERRARFTTWLYTIARNLARDEARRAAHRGGPAARPGDPPAPEPAADDPSPERAAENALLRPMLEAALASLPEEQREVFLLREHAGVSFAEIAAITGAPVPSVKSRMRYALEALRRRLGEMGLGPERAAGGGTP